VHVRYVLARNSHSGEILNAQVTANTAISKLGLSQSTRQQAKEKKVNLMHLVTRPRDYKDVKF